jgi:hypothetical protein
MRKKIFIIHGKGERQGLGRESGGDLDTVSSNAFYGIWMENLVADNGDATYEEDYEFDFLNYQEGLRHLDVHSGCDLYLPDFPIDALAPRLQIHRLRRPEAAAERARLYRAVDKIRTAFHRSPDKFPDRWKTVYNTLQKKTGKYLDERKFYEIHTARLYADLLFACVRQIYQGGTSSVVDRISDFLFGDHFKQLQKKLETSIDNDIKDTIVDHIDSEYVDRRLLVDESSRSDYGRMYRLKDSVHLSGVMVETLSVAVGTCFLIPEIETVVDDSLQSDLHEWTQRLTGTLSDYFGGLTEFLTKVLDANADNDNVQLMHDRSQSLQSFFDTFSYDFLMEDYQPEKNRFHVQVTEEASGRPVDDLEVVFNVSEGPIEITPASMDVDRTAKNLSLKTNENGYAAVTLLGLNGADNYGVTATYDDLNFLSFPKTLQLGDDYFEEHPDPDSIELDLFDYLSNGSGNDSVDSGTGNVEQIEEGSDTPSERSINVQCQMIERHLRHLNEKGVRLIRIDDHHPYTPEVLNTLENLKENGLLETITLSSLPRGEHQPKEDQLCGADLIYRQFIRDTDADNQGLSKLCHATHLQDLHIEEDRMAIQLSKLIGSKFSKTEMARGLMQIDSEGDYDSILQQTGWEEKITTYEQGLSKVLPRVDLTLHRLTFSIPPSNGNFEDSVDWGPFQFPVKYFVANDKQKQHLLREQYHQNAGSTVTVLCALSPFCDPDKGEPQINVASALNYLTPRYDFDYFFYAYGSMLLSTRRVNEDGFDIDLSDLVSEFGSPSDGGHPGAATGSPESNPNFPVDRFESVDHKNFSEYIYYISNYVEDYAGLQLHKIEELYPNRFEAGVRKKLEDLEEQSYRMDLRGQEGVANIVVADSVYTDSDEGDVTVPLACAHLRRTFPDADYVFYSVSTSNLVMRNLDDERETLNLDKIARILGTHQDGGHPRAATCKPRFNTAFPEEKFDYVNYENMDDYVNYLADRILEDVNLTQKDVEKLKESTFSGSADQGGS